MPVIITGEAGNNGVGDFVSALRAGRGDALARREAKQREDLYQKDLQLVQMQIESAEAERDLGGLWGQALGEQAQLGEAKDAAPAVGAAGQAVGGPMGALMKMQAEGVGQLPEEQVSLSYLMNRFPQGLELMGRLSGDARSRFVRDVTAAAAEQMEAEQLEEALGRVAALGLDPSQFQGRDSDYINREVDGFYAEESEVLIRQQEEDAWMGGAQAILETLPHVPRDVKSRLLSLSNEIARARAMGLTTSFLHKINQALSTAEKEMGMTAGSLGVLIQHHVSQAGGGGGGGGRSSGGGGASQPSQGSAPAAPEPEIPQSGDTAAPRPRDPEIDRSLQDQGRQPAPEAQSQEAAQTIMSDLEGRGKIDGETYDAAVAQLPARAVELLRVWERIMADGSEPPSPEEFEKMSEGLTDLELDLIAALAGLKGREVEAPEGEAAPPETAPGQGLEWMNKGAEKEKPTTPGLEWMKDKL